MSDQITEEYQEQVLDDLSDIKESVTTDSGYQEKVLDDLEDIKESVSEEQEYYDKEFQKKVLGNLRSLQKSVEDLNLNYDSIDAYYTGNGTVGFSPSGNNISIMINRYGIAFYAFDVKDISDVYLTITKTNNNNGSLSHVIYHTKSFFTNTDPSLFYNSSDGSLFPISNYTEFPDPVDKYLLNNSDNLNYLCVTGYDTSGVDLFKFVNSSDDNNDVTSGSSVMVDGIDTLIQISTFQGFASALLTGILLFLLFVKGLRR